jgi:hypothetical protein
MFEILEDSLVSDGVIVSIGLTLPGVQEETAAMISQGGAVWLCPRPENEPAAGLAYESVFPKTEVGRVKEKLKKLTREWSEPYRPHMILAKATTNFRDLPVIE